MKLLKVKNIIENRKKDLIFLVIWSIFLVTLVIVLAKYAFPNDNDEGIKDLETCGYLGQKPCSSEGCKAGLENINGLCRLKEEDDDSDDEDPDEDSLCGRFGQKPCTSGDCFTGLIKVNGICKVKVDKEENDSTSVIAQGVRITQLILTIVIGYGVSESARGKSGGLVRLLPYIIIVYIGLTQFEIISTPNSITNWIVVAVSLLLLFFFLIVRKQITLGVKIIYLIGLFFTAIFSILAQYSNVFNSALETEPEMIPAIIVTSITSFILFIFIIGHIRNFGFDMFSSVDDYENGTIELQLNNLASDLKEKQDDFDEIINNTKLDEDEKDQKLDNIETEASEIVNKIKKKEDRIKSIEFGNKKKRFLLNLSKNAIFTDVFSDVSSMYNKMKKKREQYNEEVEKNEKSENL
jgi:hypothetical protein